MQNENRTILIRIAPIIINNEIFNPIFGRPDVE